MLRTLKYSLVAASLALAVGAAGTANAGETYGVASGQWIFVPASDFMPANPACGWSYVGTGYWTMGNAPGGTCGSGVLIRAGIELPEGAAVTFWRTYYSNTAAVSITTFLTRYDVDNFDGTNPSTSDLANDTATTTTGFAARQFNFPTPLVIDTFDTSVATFRQRNYNMIVNLPTGAATMFKGVAVGYFRQIAPAPAAASFSDVPTSHPFFNEVEQMRKSGITLGCGGSQFCPDQPVTRGQMAAFMTRAMGLHWDWGTDVAP